MLGEVRRTLAPATAVPDLSTVVTVTLAVCVPWAHSAAPPAAMTKAGPHKQDLRDMAAPIPDWYGL
jgi:hypothetical protein